MSTTPSGTRLREGVIELGARNAAPGFAELYVRDHGPGIAPRDLPHVFDRFYRSADETAGSGAGLGLAISREIVRAHGGEIRAESPPEGGSVFAFTLPLAPAATEAHEAPRPRTSGPPGEVSEAGS